MRLLDNLFRLAGLVLNMQFVENQPRPSPIGSMSRSRGITFSPNRSPKKAAAVIKRAAVKAINRRKHRINCK